MGPPLLPAPTELHLGRELASQSHAALGTQAGVSPGGLGEIFPKTPFV